MAAAWIVEALDEFEDRTTCFGLCLEPTPIEQLALEGREETLAHRVVVRVADRAHRWAHACITTAATELDRGILAGLKWSSQHDLVGLSVDADPIWTSIAPCSVSSRTGRRYAPVPQAASWTRPTRGALPEAGRLQGMVLLVSPRNLHMDP